MRSAHRKLHVIFWLAVVAATVWMLTLAIGARPVDPTAELPESISGEAP